MKRDIKRQDVERRGFKNERQFQVEASAEMFDLISDSLYSHSVKAIIRELACNAFDSHEENGNPEEPFDVKLPTKLDPEFFIRDYGVGMSPTEIEELYTVVFKSDKTDTNDLTGCFGVGSKSPFAYTDQFTVEAIQDGKRWIYSVYLNEEKIPSIAEMEGSPFDVDKRDGVKIKFTVNKEDINKFHQVSKEAFRPFEVKPNILGADVEIPEYEVKLSGERWDLVDGSYEWKDEHRKRIEKRGLDPQKLARSMAKAWGISDNISRPKAIMGRVEYNIDTSQINNYIPRTILKFQLGELTPAANREHLQYDKKTVAKLEERFAQVRGTIRGRLKDKIDEAGTYREACRRWRDLSQEIPVNFNNPPEYRDTGQQVRSGYWKIRIGDVAGLRQIRRYIDGEKHRSADRSAHTIKFYFTSTYIEYDWQKYPVTFIYADQDYAKWSRSQYYSQQNPEECVYVVGGSESALEKVKEEFCVQDHLLVSELDSPSTSVKRSKPSDKAEANWLKFDPHNFADTSNYRDWWELAEGPEECLYVPIKRFKWRDGNKVWEEPSELKKKVQWLQDMGWNLSDKLFGVKTRFLEEAQEQEGWMSLDEKLEEVAELMYEELESEIDFLYSKNPTSSTLRMLYDVLDKEKDQLEDPLFEKFREFFPVELAENREQYAGSIRKLRRALMDQLQEIREDKQSETQEIFEKMQDRYPIFFQYMNKQRRGSHMDVIESTEEWREYFNSVYSCKHQ